MTNPTQPSPLQIKFKETINLAVNNATLHGINPASAAVYALADAVAEELQRQFNNLAHLSTEVNELRNLVTPLQDKPAVRGT